MQIGCCCAVDDAERAFAAGFDYIECQVVSLLPDSGDAEFQPLLAQYEASSIPILAFNVFLPRDLKIVGPTVDAIRISRYVERAVERVARIGGKIIVFGSGGARAIPPGFSQDQALEQIGQFLHTFADFTDGSDVTLAIEPLNKRECNVINSVAEAVELAQRVNRPSIQVLADFYHMDEENEPLQHILQFKESIVHIHVADTNRHAPGTGQYPYQEIAAKLHESGYNGMVSIECRWNNFQAEAPVAVKFLRQLLG